MQITTSTGFAAEVNPRKLMDMAFLEAFARMQGGEPLQLFSVLSIILGEDGKARLYQHCAEQDQDGIVTAEAVKAELVEILRAMKKDKDGKKF